MDGTTYYYVVSAVNAGGNEGPNSTSVSAQPLVYPVPGAPTSVSSTTSSDGTVELDWNQPTTGGPVDDYKVKRSTVSGGPYSIIGTSPYPVYIDTTAAAGTTFYYVISGVNKAGEGANSSKSVPCRS